MTRSTYKHARLDFQVVVVLAVTLFACSAASTLHAQNVKSDESDHLTGIKSLKNSDIDWKGFGFGSAGPGVMTANAKKVEELDVKVAEQLVALVDDPDSFIVAHVLLTRAWRIPRKDKEWISMPISTGHVVAYNGLIVKIDWKDVDGKATKTVTFPEMDLQQKRIAFWWKARFRDYPSEFSPKTRVE